MKISIVGPYPPPYGGVSVHIKRVKKFLEEKGESVIVFAENKLLNIQDEKIKNLYKIDKRILYKELYKSQIIHFHSINIRLVSLIYILSLFGKKTVLTLHNSRIDVFYKSLSNYKKFMFRLYLKGFSNIVYVNKTTKNFLLDLGLERNKIKLIPAYINPIEELEEVAKIPYEVVEFVKTDDFLISANGWVRLFPEPDLYGIDMLIELIDKLNKNNFNVKLVFALIGKSQQNIHEKKYYGRMKKLIKEKKLENKIKIFETKNTEFYPIAKMCDLSIRATNSDGYGNSVSESLFFNIPVIASDVCIRPKGTILFKTRNSEDLYNKTIDVINNYDEYKKQLENNITTDFSEKLYDLYKLLV